MLVCFGEAPYLSVFGHYLVYGQQPYPKVAGVACGHVIRM